LLACLLAGLLVCLFVCVFVCLFVCLFADVAVVPVKVSCCVHVWTRVGMPEGIGYFSLKAKSPENLIY